MNQIDFLATQPQYFDHIAPIWDALPEDNIGTFYVPFHLIGYAQRKLKNNLYLFQYDEHDLNTTYSRNPILVAAYGDMKCAHRVNPSRGIFMMEHGTGHGFGGAAWPNGPGGRDVVNLFLPPNQYTADKIHSVRDTPCEVIGTPKLDWVKDALFEWHDPPVVCISFHHGHKKRKPPEAGSAFEHYADFIPELKKHFNLVAHGHPLSRERDVPFFERLGIHFLHDFEEVLRTVDIYVNDLSSTLYEFITAGKPVVVLNAPWFRREVYHGLRFWDYTDIGFNVDEPDELIPAIEATIKDPNLFAQRRKDTVRDLFPYFGSSVQRAVQVIREQLSEAKDAIY